jgi:hypothetical protein
MGGVQDKRLVVLKEKASKGNAAAQNEVRPPLTYGRNVVR